MSLTESEKYYLARFLSNRYGVSLERVDEFIEDPEVENWREFEFVSDPLRFSHKSIVGEFSTEFLERESQLHTATKAYCRNNPIYVEDYIDLIQATPEKETELDLDMTNTWYEEDQVPEIVTELTNKVQWLQSNIYTEDLPEDYQTLYDLNLSILLYGLDNSDSRVSVDYMNGHHTLRSKSHSNGYVDEDRYGTYARSIGMRLVKIFSENDDEIEDFETLSDTVVEELSPYYEGPIRQLVRKVEESLASYSEQDV